MMTTKVLVYGKNKTKKLLYKIYTLMYSYFINCFGSVSPYFIGDKKPHSLEEWVPHQLKQFLCSICIRMERGLPRVDLLKTTRLDNITVLPHTKSGFSLSNSTTQYCGLNYIKPFTIHSFKTSTLIWCLWKNRYHRDFSYSKSYIHYLISSNKHFC